ncbi:MAG: type VII secretion-associated serine protease mycosin [Pseudonocardiaceae bacterium]|nr:type VII secretion-associated serine protease mycosin [Pseudonocardiaceae bacterium]
MLRPMRAGRRAAVIAATVLLCLVGPARSGSAQNGVEVPPPVDPGQRPSAAEATTFPYRAEGQVGPPAAAPCITSLPGQLAIEATPDPQQRLRIREAHEFATGVGQTVAVIDSGVNPHPRLRGRLADGGDYIAGETGLSDCEGHGTVVAGIIAAAPDPSTGFVGVSPGARILSIRQGSTFFEVEVADPGRPGRTKTMIAGDTRSMARAIVHAVELGATVINISEAACYPASQVADGTIPDRDLQAAVHHAAESDVVVVVAAANTGGECEQNDGTVRTIVSPAWFDDDVLAVGATDASTGLAAAFSVRGSWVDVAAPGTGIISLDPTGRGLTSTIADTEGNRFPIRGTSFATPYVAGLAALIRERYPELTARQVTERIEQTAQHPAGPPGPSQALGHGVMDPVAALTKQLPGEQAARPAPAPAPPARLEDVRFPEQQDPMGRIVVLVGVGAGIGLLGLTLLTAHRVRRYRRRKLAGTYRVPR